MNSKIGTLTAEEERIEDCLDSVGPFARQRVYETNSQRELANDVSWRDAVHLALTYDGRDYEIRPRMGTVCDSNGEATGTSVHVNDIFGLEWDVYFRDGEDRAWRKSRITAYGSTERRALSDLLTNVYRYSAWSRSVRLDAISGK